MGSLNACQTYWIVLASNGCAGIVKSSPLRLGLFESSAADLVVTVESGDDNLHVMWRSNDENLQQQLQSVQVTVRSVCPTGVVPPQHQDFNVQRSEGESVNVRRLGVYTN